MMRRRPRAANGKPYLPAPDEAALFRWRPGPLRQCLPRPVIATCLLVLLCLLAAPLHLHQRARAAQPTPRVCMGSLYALSAHRDRPGHAVVQVGDCALQFVSGKTCPPAVAHDLPTLPCASGSLTLTSGYSGRILRAFGVRSRSDASLPLAVKGAVVPLHAGPVKLLNDSGARPAEWSPSQALPPAEKCKRGQCRAVIRAMLAAYLAGCGPLAEDSAWETPPDPKEDPQGDLKKDSPMSEPLLAFPRACGRAERPDPVAEAILRRYLAATCEVPESLRGALRRLRVGSHAVRAKFVAHAVGGEGILWRWSAHAVCSRGVRFYGYDPWREDRGVMTQILEMRTMSFEG